MKFGYKFLFFIILNVIFGNLFAQELPKLQVKIDTNQIRIGEQIRLRLQAETDTLSFVDFPELSELGDFEVVESSNVDTLQDKPIRKLTKDYYITQWDSGQYVIPQINLQINDSILKTDSIPNIKVLSVKVDTVAQPAYGNKNIINIEGKDATKKQAKSAWYWWLLGLLLLIPIIYFILKKRKEFIEKRKPVPPYELAVNQWNSLKNDKLWLQDKIDEHYLHLTELLKNYLEKELGISAKEKLSSELIQDLKKYRFEDGTYFNDELLQRLDMMLKRADLAKFAKLKPNDADIDLDLQLTKDFIDTTHNIVSKIEEEKAMQIAEFEARKKRKRKIAYITIASILGLLLLIGGGTYYFLKKYGVLEQVKENISAPEWLYSEYGSNPAIGITTPHILKPYDFMKKLSEKDKNKLKMVFDEFSVYTEQNLLKGYVIMEMNINLKQFGKQGQDIKFDSKALNPLILNEMLQNIEAKNVDMKKDETEYGERYYGSFDITVPKINMTHKFEFETRIYNGDKYIRTLIVVNKKGSQENKEISDRVLSSIELIKE